jgi:hypothetical protein
MLMEGQRTAERIEAFAHTAAVQLAGPASSTTASAAAPTRAVPTMGECVDAHPLFFAGAAAVAVGLFAVVLVVVGYGVFVALRGPQTAAAASKKKTT